jgi:PAS domain S-box-containing protein
MNLLYRLSLKEKIFLLTLAICLVVWISFALVLRMAFQPDLSYELFLILAAPLCIFLLLARKLASHITKPIMSLTNLADKISEGDLDVELDFGKKVRCWEIKDCNESQCPAYGRADVLCWFVDGTPCRDCVPRFPDKLVQCRKCFVYKDHKGDEIIQLADSFKHMVSELKESRHELEKSHRFQDGVISHTFDGIIGADMKGNILIFNNAASDLTQYSKAEVIGRMKIQDFFPLEFGLALWQRLQNDIERSTGLMEQETQFKTRGEDFIPVKVTICLLKSDHEPYGIVCFIKDLREIERLKEELLKSERLALVGEITSALSHSIRNIIDGIRGGSYVLKSGQEKERWELVTKGWEMIDRNLHRIDELMYELLNVSESQTLNVVTYDINRLLEETLPLVRGRVERASIRLETRLGGSLLLAKIDPDAIRHCLLNLLLNAIDACEAVEGGQREIQIHTADVDEDWACVTISDNGPGMRERTKDKIFKEIFTSRGSFRLGLGLFVTGRLIKQHGGTVDIDSKTDLGTKVTVKLLKKAPAGQSTGQNLELSG